MKTWLRRGTAFVVFASFLIGGWSDSFWVKGSFTSARWFEYLQLADPLAAIEVGFASGQWPAKLWLAASPLFLLALFSQRSFCRWFCPLGFLFSTLRSFRSHSKPVEPVCHYSKPNLWALSLILIISFTSGLPVFQILSPINSLILGLVFGLQLYLILPALAILLDWFYPRLFCKNICPLGNLPSMQRKCSEQNCCNRMLETHF
ncbi:MAG: 4Fe-4S binding protein [Planctomycetota bacterium]|jgi:polyferredoxin|nr:4Fe-4S binding protein [Planctomycetota bacterium]MDP6941267.1 4Fe-4S binding protein [Planctomycetota bacterium]